MASTITLTIVTLCWLASAIGLFYRKRLAWWGSTLAIGMLMAWSVTMLAAGIKLLPKATDPTDGIGFMLIFGVMGIVFFLPLLIGLFWLRRAWKKMDRETANAQSNAAADPLANR